MAEYTILPIRPITTRDFSGIYAIIHTASGKLYVGSAATIAARWGAHRYQLRRGTHHSQRLQNSWKKYGERAFEFVVLEIVNDAALRFKREQHWIESLRAAVQGFGFNIHPSAGGPRGHRLSAEVRAKMSAARKGKKYAPRRPEHSAAISAAKLGKGGWKLPKRSEQHRKAISASKLGKKINSQPTKSASHRAAISAAKLGKKASESAKANMGLIRKGKPLSPMHAAKIRTVLTERNRTAKMRCATAENNRQRAALNRVVTGQGDLFG